MSKIALAILALVLWDGTQIALAQSNASTTASPDSTMHKKHHARSRALGATRPSNSSGPGIGSGVYGQAGGPGGAGTSEATDGFGGGVGIGGRR